MLLFISNAFEAKAEEFIIIANIKHDISALTKDEISDIFLKKISKWEDGSKIIPVDLSSDSKTRMIFTERIHQKKVSNIRAYWQQCLFSGKHSPPLELKTDRALIEYIRNNPGSVGYVSASSDYTGLKRIKIVSK